MMIKNLTCLIALALVSQTALAVSGGSLPTASSLSQTQRQPEHQHLQLTRPDIAIPASNVPQSGAEQQQNHVRIVLDKIKLISDATTPGMTEQQAQQAVADYLHRPLSLAEIRQLADKLTTYYQQQGYLLGQVLLFPQQITDHTLTLKLVPGSYADVQIHNLSTARDPLIRAIVQNNIQQNQPIKTDEIRHMALLLQNIPGTESAITFRAGDTFGSSSLEVTSKDSKKFSGYIGLDNQGDATIGKSRVFIGGQVNNLSGFGDSLTVNLLDAYEKSNLFTGSLDYNSLINSYGSRAGVSYTRLNYQYNLSGRKFTGSSDNYSLYISHPLILKTDNRLNIRASANQQLVTDGFVKIKDKKSVSYANIGIDGILALPANMGIASYQLSDTFGHINYKTKFFDNGFNKSGFNKVNYKLDYKKQLYDSSAVYTLELYAKLEGQFTGGNLDPSQKFIAGGAYGLRGYSVGEGALDQGAMFTLELRNNIALPYNFTLSASAFFDQASGQQYRKPPAGETNNHLSLSDAGVYLELAKPGGFSARLTVAKKLGSHDPNVLNSKDTQIWVSAVKAF